MKILFFDSPAFAKQDMIDAFEDMNIACDLFFTRSTTTDRALLFLPHLMLRSRRHRMTLSFPLIITLSSPPAVSVMESVMFPTSMTAHW